MEKRSGNSKDRKVVAPTKTAQPAELCGDQDWIVGPDVPDARAIVNAETDAIQPEPKSQPIKRRADAGWWVPEFLVAYRRLGTIEGAAKAVGIDSSTVRKYQKTDEAFKADLADALDDFADGKEALAWEMAERNPVLLIFMLKGVRPEKYRENGPSVTVNNNRVESILVDLVPLDAPVAPPLLPPESA